MSDASGLLAARPWSTGGVLDRAVLRLLGGRPPRDPESSLSRLEALLPVVQGQSDWLTPQGATEELEQALASAQSPPGQARGARRWQRVRWNSDVPGSLPGPQQLLLGDAANRRAEVVVRWGEPKAPAVILLHGHLLGDAALQRLLLPWRAAAEHGHTVALMTLPLHGSRAVRGGALPGRSPALNLQGVAQGTRELLQLSAALSLTDERPIHWVGQSLGGLVVSLAATRWRPARAALLSPLVSLAQLAHDSGALGEGDSATTLLRTLRQLYAPVEPLGLPSLLPGEYWLLAGGRDDLITPPAGLLKLAAHLGTEAQIHPGGHLLPLGEGWSRRQLGQWLTKV
jgi:hypothetical protein